MIIFDQLRISDDEQHLYINVHVNNADLFKDTTIEGLYICLGNQVYESLTIDPDSNGYIYSKTFEAGTKEIDEVISISDDSLIYNKSSFKDLFFVYIKCNNVPKTSECYTQIGNYVIGITFDENLLYQQVMQFTKTISDDCSVPDEFIDFILLWNAFKSAVETEHYIPALKFYNMLFGKNSVFLLNNSKHCGCHG